jgi:hypothetical protein
MHIDDYTLLILRTFTNGGPLTAEGPGAIDTSGRLINSSTITLAEELRIDGTLILEDNGEIMIEATP